MKFICLYRNTGSFEADETVFENFKTGKTYDDYVGGLVIVLSDEQKQFRLYNPGASAKEIIEMELVPSVPEPTLEEHKESALNAVENEVKNKLEENYPLRELVDNIVRVLSETGDEYLTEYNSVSENMKSELTDARERIELAEDIDSVNSAINRVANLDVDVIRDNRQRPPLLESEMDVKQRN